MIGQDALLLQRLIDEDKLTAKALAYHSNRDGSTIYRYLNGEKTIPLAVLSEAWQITGDLRIVQLLLGRRPLVLQPTETLTVGRPCELVPQCTEALKQAANCVEYIAKIVADGRVDRSDDGAIEQFARHAARVQEIMPPTLAALRRLRSEAP